MSRERRVSLIAAMAENRVIGVNNKLPWHLPADLRHFRQLTTGHPVIMGRRNYESIGKPLPDRANIVVTRNPAFRAPGCQVKNSLEEALREIQDKSEIFIIGGAEIYRQSIGSADRIYLTLVHAEIDGDTYFPEFDRGDWQEVSRVHHTADEKNPYAYSFVTYDRRKNK
ncbi:MAG: type 3 dihydrofolate reductase [Sulfuricaulis sp.]|nr:type 3 dihydrofolate reductase [Sulfuricaulis sp.]